MVNSRDFRSSNAGSPVNQLDSPILYIAMCGVILRLCDGCRNLVNFNRLIYLTRAKIVEINHVQWHTDNRSWYALRDVESTARANRLYFFFWLRINCGQTRWLGLHDFACKGEAISRCCICALLKTLHRCSWVNFELWRRKGHSYSPFSVGRPNSSHT